MSRQTIHKTVLAFVLVTLGIAFRTVWHTGDNVEFVTTAALLSGAYLGLGFSIAVPLVTMAVSDFIIGNTNIFIFTWSAYLLIGIFGRWGLGDKNLEFRIKNHKLAGKLIKATGFGAGASLWFYLWTNFGVWLLDSSGMYPKTLGGLWESYWYGLPFLKLNLLGNLFFVPLSFFIAEKLKNLNIGLWGKLAV